MSAPGAHPREEPQMGTDLSGSQNVLGPQAQKAVSTLDTLGQVSPLPESSAFLTEIL